MYLLLLPKLEAQQAEKAGESRDALTQLTDRIPQPYLVQPMIAETSLRDLALLTREFNRGMGLTEGFDEDRDCGEKSGVWKNAASGGTGD